MITTLNWCPQCEVHLPDDWTHCKNDHRAVRQMFSCVPVEAVEHTLAPDVANVAPEEQALHILNDCVAKLSQITRHAGKA